MDLGVVFKKLPKEIRKIVIYVFENVVPATKESFTLDSLMGLDNMYLKRIKRCIVGNSMPENDKGIILSQWVRTGFGYRCGVVMNFKPFHDLVKRGVNPDKAWKKTKEKILARARYGTWRKDFYVAGPDEQGQRYCHMDEIK